MNLVSHYMMCKRSLLFSYGLFFKVDENNMESNFPKNSTQGH